VILVETYLYSNILSPPNFNEYDAEGVLIGGMEYDIQNSAMTNKNYVYFLYRTEDELCTVVWNAALSAGDKTLLDTIVANNC
jgi:hypothetical protein